MGLLRWLATGDADPTDRSPTSDFWYTDPGSGMLLSRDGASQQGALSVGAVYRCVSVVSNAVAQLPLKLYRRTYEDGVEVGKEPAKDHPLYRLVALAPNAWQTGVEWRRQTTALILLRGNAYQLLLTGADDQIEQMVPLRPDHMKVEQLPGTWRKRYTYRWDDGREVKYAADEVLHFPALSTDGLVGLSPIELMRRTIETARDMEDFQSREFSTAPKLAGFLKSKLEDVEEGKAEQEKAFADSWRGRRGWHGVPVLPPHLDWQSVGISGRDAQFLESRKFEVTEICRWFGVPPHLVMDLDRATFSNIEHQSLDFLMHSIMPWLRLIEDRMTLDLCAGEPDLFFEFSVDALLRADSLTRAQTQQIYLGTGVLSPNEVRAIENRNPREGGDDYLMQVNATRPIGPAGGAARPAPPAPAGPAGSDPASPEDSAP